MSLKIFYQKFDMGAEDNLIRDFEKGDREKEWDL